MKTARGIPLNIRFLESLLRILLIIPTGGLAVLAVVFIHGYIFLLIPPYLLATGLTNYSPIKHMFRLIMHTPVFTGSTDWLLSSPVM